MIAVVRTEAQDAKPACCRERSVLEDGGLLFGYGGWRWRTISSFVVRRSFGGTRIEMSELGDDAFFVDLVNNTPSARHTHGQLLKRAAARFVPPARDKPDKGVNGEE